MFYLKLKDIKKRKNFKKLELRLRLKNFIFKNILAYLYYKKNYSLHSFVSFQMLKKKKKRLSTRITNRCILTNRFNSIRQLKISRIKARELLSFGIIPGYKKAVW